MNAIKETFDRFRIPDETELLGFFEGVFNLDAINMLLEYKESESPDHFLPFYMRGYYLPIYQQFGGNIYDICRNAVRELGFGENDIEFYVANDASFNSSSIFTNREKSSHIIIINRGLIEKVGPKELSFIVGHEIGHLIYRHSYISRAIQFVYPAFGDLPPFLQKLYDIWNKICEFSADRIGLIACADVECSIKALFKLSSGLEDKYFDLTLDNLVQIIDKTYAEMKANPSYISSSHPANPFRIKALLSFSESELWKSKGVAASASMDNCLKGKMDEILGLLKKSPINDREENELKFLASAGLVLMGCDNDMNEDEYNYLVNILSYHIHWPPALIKTMLEGDPMKALKESAELIMGKTPWRAKELAEILFIIVIRDRRIKDVEIKAYLSITTEELKLPQSVVVDIILGGIRNSFRPLY